MSSGFPTLAVVLLMGAGDMATRKAFQWEIGVPDVVTASGEVARFLNDIASYKKGKNKKDVASSVECYAKEHGTSGEEAVTAIAGMAEHAWRTINRSCMEMDSTLAAEMPTPLLPTSRISSSPSFSTALLFELFFFVIVSILHYVVLVIRLVPMRVFFLFNEATHQ